jgi:hypothetical protein
VPSTEPEGKKRTVTKKKSSTTKANTSKPRAKVAGGRVTKKSTVTKAKKNPVAKAKDRATGAAEKVAGKVEGKPGKKGMFIVRDAL